MSLCKDCKPMKYKTTGKIVWRGVLSNYYYSKVVCHAITCTKVIGHSKIILFRIVLTESNMVKWSLAVATELVEQ